MKPNIKSSVIFMALLFLFSGNAFCALRLPSDTLIIDGEIIYIEEEEVSFEVDSSANQVSQDVPKKTVSRHPFAVAIYAGANLTFSDFSTSLGDHQPLDVFVGNEKTKSGNLFAEADFSYNVADIKTARGKLGLSLHSGVGVGKIKINCTVLSDLNEFDRDSLIRLTYEQGEIFLNYFTFISWPIGEPDTVAISFEEEQMQFTTLDLPLRLRVSWSGNNSDFTYFAEAGVVYRSVIRSKTYDNFLVNEQGNYVVLKAEEFQPMNLWRPQFSLGFEYRIPGAMKNNGEGLGLGMTAMASMPKAAFNSGNLFWTNISSARIGFFLRYHF